MGPLISLGSQLFYFFVLYEVDYNGWSISPAYFVQKLSGLSGLLALRGSALDKYLNKD